MDGSIFDITLVEWNQGPFVDGKDTTRPELNDAAYNTSGAMAEPKKFGSELLNGIGGDGDIKVPFTRYSPEKIFSGAVPAFDVNFIDPREWTDENGNVDNNMQNKSIANILHDTIAKWYVALRNLAIVGMLIILLYVGIRIIVSSTASDKAKYKEFLKDWLIALCLLFTLHYIMTFTVTVVNSITESIAGENPGKGTNNIPIIVVKGDATAAESGTAENAYFKFNTDIMGYARFLVQYDDLGTKVLYFIIYIGMVIYTFMFTITYLKRSLTMAFLTMIAPLIAITYPIDKIGDGSAQGFNSWLKEYVYNALIQPFHLIIYTVFAGAAVADLSASNPIYAIIVLAFISQSEKLLRKFFGFDKASSAGSLGSFAGGAAAMSITQKLLGSAANRRKGGSGGSGNSGKIRTQSGTPIEDNNAPGIGEFADSRIAGSSSGGTTGGGTGGTSGSGTVLLGGGTPSGTSGSGAGNVGGSGSGGEILTGSSGGNSGLIEGAGPVRGDYRTSPSGIILHNDTGRNLGSSTSTTTSTSQTPRTISTGTPTSASASSASTTPKDTRGLAQFTRDWAASTRPARWARSVKDSAGSSVRDMANRAKIRFNDSKVGQLAAKANAVPVMQPLKNSLKGAGGVAANIGKRALKAAPRVAGRAALGALGASVGVAAGIAGGDIEDIVKFGAAGAGLGSTMGYSALTGLGSSIAEGASDIRDTYNIEAHGLNAAQLAEQRRTLRKDKDRMNRIDDLMPTEDGHKRTAKEKKELLEKSIDYTEAGITDEKKIVKAMKLENSIVNELKDVQGMTDQEKADSAKRRAMIAAQFAERVDDKKLVDEKYVEQVTKSWTRGMMDPERGINEAQARREAENMMRYVKKLKKVN